MRISGSNPVLAVHDLERSADWFCRVLGCERRDPDPGNWVFCTSGAVTFMLGRCPGVAPASALGDHSYLAYLLVDSVDEFHARAVAEGAEVLKPPTDEPWGRRELALRSPDGHRFMLAQALDPAAGAPESKHLSEWVDCSPEAAYDYASDPAHLPEWAPGLGDAVEHVGDEWFVATSEGRVGFAFVPRNELGVLDHRVTLPTGETVYVPLRVLPADGGCEIVFTLRRQAAMSDEDFERDAATVRADLALLKRVLESREPGG